MKRVCPYCLKTSYVCVESFPKYRIESFFVEGEKEAWVEIDEDYCDYTGSKPHVVYCPECENKYENCSTPEEAWELMLLVE